MTVETRVIIDANANNAIRALEDLDSAAGDADKSIGKVDGATVDVDTSDAVTAFDDVEFAAAVAKDAADKLDAQRVAISVDESDVVDAGADVDAVADKTKQPFKIDFDVDTDKLDTLKRKTDDVGTSAGLGSTAIGGIGGSVSELPGIGALGPIAESLGQLTENALEGDVAIADIGKTIGLLGGTALVMAGIQKAMQSIADTKAFNEEQVTAFKDALKETGDAATAVLDTIKEAEGIKGRSGGIAGLFEGTEDITADLLEAKVSADEFILAVTPGPEAPAALQHVVDKLKSAKDAAVEQRDAARASADDEAFTDLQHKVQGFDGAIEIVNETLRNNTTAMESNKDMNEFLATATDKTKQETEKWDEWLRKITGKLEDATAAADKLREANEKLRGDLNNREAYLNLQSTLEDLETAGTDAMTAVATGATDAETATREFELQQIAAKESVLDYVDQVESIPPEKQTEILALIDQGKYTEAQTMLAGLEQPKEIEIRFKWDQGKLNELNRSIPGGIGFTSTTRLTGMRDG